MVSEAPGNGASSQKGLIDSHQQTPRPPAPLSSGAGADSSKASPRTPGPDGGPDGERWAQLEEENSSLRELVEDLRAALQSSDARCLALQVGLWKSQAGAPEVEAERPEPEAAPGSEPEAVERELRQARNALEAAEARAGRLRQGQAEVRRRAEEARQAVLHSLGRVRELEALAGQVPGLQHWVQQLEGELQRYRSGGTQLPTLPRASPDAKSDEPVDSGPRGPEAPPDCSSGSRFFDEVDGQLFRSVEGQAASDEEQEEEEKWREGQGPPEVRTLLARLSSLDSGCDDQTAKKLMTYFGHCGGAGHARAPGGLEARIAALVEGLESRAPTGKTAGPPEEQSGSITLYGIGFLLPKTALTHSLQSQALTKPALMTA
ncbi:PREDICTED: EF-hand and coiled-coil domain-containing protein 1 [Condylura cristata]|uniref:EF-hand and coiled-coil domain-containing protein 1 n=1 Tax=Condylura cristata TaxID=143302 RepID=UPI000334564C|nr:PREDICTED: EF-hand and coiled-coil domain-containing protein 1 [Condylura cristata]